jgi:hypothetical protein
LRRSSSATGTDSQPTDRSSSSVVGRVMTGTIVTGIPSAGTRSRSLPTVDTPSACSR